MRRRRRRWRRRGGVARSRDPTRVQSTSGYGLPGERRDPINRSEDRFPDLRGRLRRVASQQQRGDACDVRSRHRRSLKRDVVAAGDTETPNPHVVHVGPVPDERIPVGDEAQAHEERRYPVEGRGIFEERWECPVRRAARSAESRVRPARIRGPLNDHAVVIWLRLEPEPVFDRTVMLPDQADRIRGSNVRLRPRLIRGAGHTVGDACGPREPRIARSIPGRPADRLRCPLVCEVAQGREAVQEPAREDVGAEDPDPGRGQVNLRDAVVGEAGERIVLSVAPTQSTLAKPTPTGLER